MRQINARTGWRRCQYPNTVHFANVPAIIRVFWEKDDGTEYIPENITITLSDGEGHVYSEVRAVFNLECVFDIRRFLQTVFVDVNLDRVGHSEMWQRNYNQKKITVLVSYTDNNNESVVVANFNVDAVFGNIERGESTGGNIRRRWFVNYPFTLDFYVKSGDMFSIVADGVDRPGVSFPEHLVTADYASGFARVLLNVDKLVDSFPVDKRLRIIQPFGYVAKNDEESIGLVAYDLDIDRAPKDCDKGVYLRWIDNQGRFCYWLFKDLGTSDAVAGSSYVAADLRNPLLYEGGLNVGTDVRQSFTRTKTRNLGAKAVDRDLFDFLLTVVSSPFVDVFDGYDANGVPQWHRVNVAPGTVAKTTKSLQDFTVAIVEPSQITQSL